MTYVLGPIARLAGSLITLALWVFLIIGVAFLLCGIFNSQTAKDAAVWLVKRIDLFFNPPNHGA